MKYMASVKNLTEGTNICARQLSSNDIINAFPKGFLRIGETYIWFPDNVSLEEVLNCGFQTTAIVRGKFVFETTISVIVE